jgi:hypothetical protein
MLIVALHFQLQRREYQPYTSAKPLFLVVETLGEDVLVK